MATFDKDKLRRHMAQEGHSTRTLARAMGMSHAAVSRVLQGNRQPGGRFYRGLREAFPQVEWEDWHTRDEREEA